MIFLQKINKVFLFIAILLVIATFFVTKKTIEIQESKQGPFFYTLDVFQCNIEQNSAVATIKISLEFNNYHDIKRVSKYIPYVRDICLKYFQSLRATDLQGSNILFLLREEILLRINKAIQPLVVKNILFQEILIQ